MIAVDIRLARGDFRLDAAFRSEAAVTALFGRSGAGKSSVIKAIGGLIRPAEGRIELGDTVLFDAAAGIDLPARARRIGHVFQDARLFPHMTVARNLAYGGRFSGRRPSAAEWDEVVRLLDIAPLLDRRPLSLSGGETQRVAIGRALLMSPRALMMDEPLASLDRPRKAEILPYLDRLTAEARVPIVYVSHVLEEVTRLAGAIVVLEAGRVVASGPVGEVVGRGDLAWAGDAGEAGTVLVAEIAYQDERWDLTGFTVAGQALLGPRVRGAPGARAHLLVRAHDVALATAPPSGLSIRNCLAGRVTRIADAGGAEADVSVDIGGAVLRARVTRMAVDELALEPGSPVHALVKCTAIGRSPGPDA
jgi:molybdate transport system ATP-binding protein